VVAVPAERSSDERRRANRHDHDPCTRTDGPIAVVAVSLARRCRAWRCLDPGRARSHDGGQRVGPAHGEGQRYRAQPGADWLGGGDLHHRGVLGGVVLWSADRPLRAAQSVHPDAGGVPGLHRCNGVRVRALVLLHHALLHRFRDRGRICRDQLGDRRVDPGAGARPRGVIGWVRRAELPARWCC
jgi:hypothetical protein